MKKFKGIHVGVFGHSETKKINSSALAWIEMFGKCLADVKAVLYTGGGGGVMHAVRKGCLKKGGEVVSIIPGMDLDNGYDIDQLRGNIVASGQGKLGRVHLLTQSVSVGFAFGGGAGTLLEIISCYLLAKPVVVIDDLQGPLDPKIGKILTNVKESEMCGENVIQGFLDGKDESQVCPITICPKHFLPSRVLEIGLFLQSAYASKHHKMY